MFRTHVSTGLICIGLIAAATVQAQEDSGFYVGAGIGEATDKVDGFEDSGTAFRILGGYAFNRYLAAEVAYIDAGELEDTIDGADITVESTGVTVAALGRLPVGSSFSLFAKLGYTFYDEKVSARLGNLSASEKNSDEDPLYGAGAEVSQGQKFRLRAEYEVVDVSDADFNILSLGATFHF